MRAVKRGDAIAQGAARGAAHGMIVGTAAGSAGSAKMKMPVSAAATTYWPITTTRP